MRVLTVYAHPNPKSFCHAILEQFTKGLAEAGERLLPEQAKYLGETYLAEVDVTLDFQS